MTGQIIDFNNNSVSKLKQELTKARQDLEESNTLLNLYRGLYNTSMTTGDLLKLQIVDLQANITMLQAHLKMMNDNLNGMKNKLDQLEKYKGIDPSK